MVSEYQYKKELHNARERKAIDPKVSVLNRFKLERRKDMVSSAFQDTIKKYLDDFVVANPEFKGKYENPNKSISGCWKTFKATKYNADDELKAFTDFVNRNRELLELRADFNVDDELAKLL